MSGSHVGDAVLLAAGSTTLTWNETLVALVIFAVLIVVIGALTVFGHRSNSALPGDSDIRSWLAVSLVSALIMLAALTFAVDDPQTRNTLVGGIAASAGAAIAFYFSAKSADHARQDLLTATLGRERVPDLRDKTLSEAKSVLSASALALHVAGPENHSDDMVVDSHTPAAGSEVVKGSAVNVTLRPPDPSP